MLDPLHAEAGQLAHELAPALREACDGRLGSIRWFRTDWQRGGAATGYASYEHESGQPAEVVVKMPVGPGELRVLRGLGESNSAPTPAVVASGYELGGYDLGWVVMEKFEGDPLMRGLEKHDVREMAAALGAFYKHAGEKWPLRAPRDRPRWETILEKSRAHLKETSLAHGQKWNECVKHTQKILPLLVQKWESRAINSWCHGDFHPGNAMRRAGGSVWGPAGVILIDFAEVHSGHWVEDAVYLERLYWGHADRLHKQKPVSLLARARKDNGLPVEDDYAQLAAVRRVLMAACVPAFLEREGNPTYVEAALATLERLLPQVAA